ncbi:lipase, partial [Brachionus plicatilis]
MNMSKDLDFDITKNYSEYLNSDNLNSNYQEILYLCALASNAIYEDSPFDKKGIFSDCGHSISRLCVSKSIEKSDNLNLIFGLNDVKYMIFESVQFPKVLFIAFRGTQNLSDFLTDVNCISQVNEMLSGKFHSGIYSRSELINLKYFVQKINDGYKIVFTGHSLGAAVASMTAIKLTSRIHEEKAKNVFFIGFGSPLFADKTFSENFKFSENFHFYVNEDDIVNSILNDLADIIHNKKLSTMTQETDNKINRLLEVVLRKQDEANLLLGFLTHALPQIIDQILKTFVPQYHPFGKLFRIQKSEDIYPQISISPSFNIISDNNSNSTLKSIKENIINQKLMSRVDNHKMNEYFAKLKNILKTKCHDVNEIVRIQDLDLKAENIEKQIILVKNESWDELFLFLCGENQDQILFVTIRNSKYNLESTSTEVSQYPFKYSDKKESKTSLVYKFNIFKCLLTSDNKLRDKVVEIDCEIFGHFNCISLKILIKESDVKDSLTHKQQCIHDMPMDKLYLTAALFVHIINKLEINDNIKDKISLLDNKIELLDIFKELDKAWAIGEANFNLDSEMKNELKGALYSCLHTDSSDDNLNTILESICFNTKYAPLRTTIDSYSSSELIGKIFPTVYKLKNDFCSTFIGKNLFKCIFRSMRNFDRSALSYLWGYYFKSKDIDDSYKFFINQIMKSYGLDTAYNDLPYLGYIETFISKNIKIEKHSNPEEQKLLVTIWYNRRIREILCENYFLGVIGTKKTGKSTFSQLLTDQNASISSVNATETAKPYVLYNDPNLILIDFAHFDNIRAENKLEFFFSVSFLNRACLIFDAQHKAETNSISNLFNLIRHASMDKYTVVFNKCDNLLKDLSGDFTGFKNEICRNLKIENTDDKEKVILASINPDLTLLDKDRISKTKMIKDREKLSLYFKNIIQGDLKKIGTEICENKENFDKKEIEIKFKAMTYKFIATRNSQSINENEEFEFFDSLDQLTPIIKLKKIKNPLICAQVDPNIIVENFDDFFKYDFHCYFVKE